MAVLVTGVAGFIGHAVALALLEAGERVIGVDNLSPYYDVNLKRARLERLRGRPGYAERILDLADREATDALFGRARPDQVVHLAAQAGVRHSLDQPHSYIDANITGFLNVLQGCRSVGTRHLVFASTSSVYGADTAMPFSVHQPVDHPLSLYAATKRSNELMAHCYAHLFGIPVTGLRFFTVYGPWGRPDMALFKFTRAILDGRPIDVFNEGRMTRDFTYIDDIVAGILGALARPPQPDPAWSGDDPDPATSGVAPFRIYNIGNGRPVPLTRYIDLLEQALGRTAQRRLLPMQPGDVPATAADISDLAAAAGYEPKTPVEIGVGRFVDWYKSYYRVAP